MPNFIVSFEQTALQKGAHLRRLFTDERREEEESLLRLFREGKHWHPLPKERRKCPHALAVDGGSRRLELANGSLLIIGQALILGEGVEDAIVDIEVVRGSVPHTTAERFADLFLQRLEVHLAAKHIQHMESEGMVLLDGALYSGLPQLYPLRAETLEDPTQQLVEDYERIFDACGRGCMVVSVAKSSRETLLSQLLQSDAGIPERDRLAIPDSEIIYRWTEDLAGFSTPVLLGTRSFTEGSSRALLEPGSPVTRMPAVVSFFLRPDDFAPAWRVDVPGVCVGRKERLGDLEAGWVDAKVLEPLIASLLADYGGPQVYHALLYMVDQEVRLSTERLMDVYLPMLEEALQVKLTPSLSSGRFLGWP
ncbi:MAG: DNA double-strand break repair nuclease NurA [Chloroflexi bacterium]|nr:DNA double-strand break repair nuclease NurA [Chloroflexota bacterium]